MSPGAGDWANLCQQIITWQPLVSRNQYGLPVWGAPQTFQGRRVFKNQRVAAYERGTKGQGPEVISSSQIWILAPLTLGYDDLVYVSGLVSGGGTPDSPPYPPILSWNRFPDTTGNDLFTKVLLGSANG